MALNRNIKAVQLVPIQHPDGTALAILSDKGVVYLKTDKGWEPQDMKVAKEDA